MSVVLIGATGGVGAALARRLAAAGRPLHLMARDEARLAALAGELGCRQTVVDVTDRAGLRRAVVDAGEISGLAYLVGTITLKPLKALAEQDFLRDYELNALGAAVAIQAALPALSVRREHPSSVVLFSSVAVGLGFPAHASIAMAKGAVEGLVRSVAAECAPLVRVNAVAPSLTRTPLAARLLASEAMAKALASTHPMQRLGEAEDIAALAAFLLSPEAGWITGQVMAVDGGRAALQSRSER